MNLLREYLAGRVERLRDQAARAMPGPMLVRLAVWAFGVAALSLAFPRGFVTSPQGLGLVIAAALLPALAPRTWAPTVVLLAAAGGWVLATAFYREPVTTVRLVALAGTMYLLHTGAALAAVLPYDTVVSPGAVGAWFARAAGVILVTGAGGVFAVTSVDRLGGRTYLIASLVGVALVGLLGWVLARAARAGEPVADAPPPADGPA